MKEIQIQREKVFAEVNIERERMGLEALGMEMDAQQAIDGGISAEPKKSESSELKEQIQQLVEQMKKPKTATLSNGKKIKIE
jgi:hypothetical protein